MTGKQLLLSALRGEPTPRPAWLPYVGVHGASLIGENATDYLRSPELIEKGLVKAAELYRPDGLPVVFDLQLEAEVLGCDLGWADKTPPSVVTHPMSELGGPGHSLEQLPAFGLDKGRFPLVFEACDRVKRRLGDDIALYGLLTGPFTLTSHLMGNDLFMQMYDDPEAVSKVVDFCAEIAMDVAEGYIQHGIDAIAVVDPMTSQISPEHFEQFVSPAMDRIFDWVHNLDRMGSIFVCGDATRNLEAMAATRCDNMAVDEQIPLDKMREIAERAGKSFGGNLKLTTVLLMGDEDDSRLNALACMDAAGPAGFVLAPGCDLPFDVRPANLVAIAEIVHDAYARDVARATIRAKDADDYSDIVLPDYAHDRSVIVDVVTLDSAACAPCQYMLRAAVEARALAGSAFPIEIREHKITNREGVGMMVKLAVPNLPSICVDGKCVAASIIPDTRALAEAIADAASAKGLAR